MRTNRLWQPEEKAKEARKQRFQLRQFHNPRTGSSSWRVAGIKLDGRRIRENFSDLRAAECRQLELQTEWLARETDTALRATKMSETQVRLAEVAFLKLDAD